MGINPMQLMQMFKGNPQQAMQQIMGNNQLANNPIARNFMDMAKCGNLSGIEEFGRNMAKERGVDFDKEFEKFKSQFGMK